MQDRILQSWGRLKAERHRLAVLDRAAHAFPERPALPIGMGRSYGDVGLNPEALALDMVAWDRFVSFDEETGVLVAEAGVTLGTVQATMLGRGWLLPVTPGTQFATLGGAVANDAHGKNHHRMGCFGNHLTHITLLRSDEGPIHCSPEVRPDLFAATIGGLGLTGVILDVGLRLRPVTSGWMETQTTVFEGLDHFFALSKDTAEDWEYSVSWVDCTNANAVRGVHFSANHAAEGPDLPPRSSRRVPLTPPVSLINGVSLKAFNALYFRANARKAGPGRQDVQSFYYPLDALEEWNRIYGVRGFYQYQSVVPEASAQAATAEMLRVIAEARQGSFLMVLKTFGHLPSPGLLSFPMPGVTLAMDFPNHGPATLRLFERLDRIVRDAGGRLYPAKDARMGRDLFEVGYPELERFRQLRDPAISSTMSKRLMGF